VRALGSSSERVKEAAAWSRAARALGGGGTERDEWEGSGAVGESGESHVGCVASFPRLTSRGQRRAFKGGGGRCRLLLTNQPPAHQESSAHTKKARRLTDGIPTHEAKTNTRFEGRRHRTFACGWLLLFACLLPPSVPPLAVFCSSHCSGSALFCFILPVSVPLGRPMPCRVTRAETTRAERRRATGWDRGHERHGSSGCFVPCNVQLVSADGLPTLSLAAGTVPA
jgi:hypothetical protein